MVKYTDNENVTFKLYLVKTRGMQSAYGSNIAYGQSYVIAENPDEAYKIVRSFLDKYELGFKYERQLESVSLIAEMDRYTDCGCLLHIKGHKVKE